MRRKKTTQQTPIAPPQAVKKTTVKKATAKKATAKKATAKKTTAKKTTAKKADKKPEKGKAPIKPADTSRPALKDAIITKLGENARTKGDVRAAALVLKHLEEDKSNDDTNVSLDACKQLLSDIEKSIAAEIISLLEEAESRAKAAAGGVEPAN
jgi:leucyl aminopeptidase